MTRLALFDLDDTLFDHRYASRCTLAELQRRYPCLRRKTLAELERDALFTLNEIHPRMMQGLLTREEARLEWVRRLFSGCGAELSDDQATEAGVLRRELYQAARRPCPGALALLEALRGRTAVGIVTNNLTAEQEDKLRCCGLERLIDFLVTSEDVGISKPDPGIFHAALERAGCPAAEAVMVGDSWQIDVLGAHAAGIRPVWLNLDGDPCPDPALAAEIRSFLPTPAVLRTVLEDSAR